MPSRLKSLELHGYKTFASRTLFEFAGPITAIVGPNGSGKSNIADALRWVLGEQSYSLLRGKKTEDMIFSGSEQRSRAGMASATIVFDNCDGWLPIDFTEVAITRRAYRDGENEYLLNGQRVRLRDVSELLAQSGLAERTYTIIGQGLVDAALALKAEERRRLFEEAAGIGLHRSRREEALRRLDATRRNLERVQDIMAELQPRLRSLERQARRAKEYEQIKADLRVVLREWYGYHWRRAQRDLTSARDAAKVREKALGAARRQQADIDEKMAHWRERIQSLRNQLGGLHHQSAGLHTRRESISRDLAVSNERLRSLGDQRQNMLEEISRLEEELSIQQQWLERAEEEVSSLEAELAEARQQSAQANQTLEARHKERLRLEQDTQEARQALSRLTARQSHLQARQTERQDQAGRWASELREAETALEQARRELASAEAQLELKNDELQQALQASQAVEEALQEHKGILAEAEVTRKESQEQVAAASADLARLKAQLDVLNQAEDMLEGYASGARLLLEAVRQSRLDSYYGALSSQLEVPTEYETAIAAALGEFVDAVLIEGPDGAERALDVLESQPARAAVLSLEKLRPPSRLDLGVAPEGVLGVAADLVRAPEEIHSALEVLLGRIFVVKDRAAAHRIIETLQYSPDARAVTLKGEIYYPSGSLLAGADQKAGLLSRPRQRRDLQLALQKTETLLEEHDRRIRVQQKTLEDLNSRSKELFNRAAQARRQEEAARTAHSDAELQVEKARRQLQWQQDLHTRLVDEIKQGQVAAKQIAEDLAPLTEEIEHARLALRDRQSALEALPLDELQTQLAHWKTRSEVAEKAVAEAKERCLERQAALERSRSNLFNLQSRLEGLVESAKDLEVQRAALREEEISIALLIDSLKTKIDPVEAELKEAENHLAELQSADIMARQSLSQAEHSHAQARINLARHQEALDSLQRRIEDDFGLVAFEYEEDISGPTPLPLDGMVEQLPKVSRLAPDIEETIRRQRGLLRRMGPINAEAQVEYDQVKERVDFLNEQISDLNKAEADIKTVIMELDLLMQREFLKTFDAVAHEFRDIFTRLFAGGSARLLLTDPDDITSSGIDIEARLPGRRSQGLSLLSGGERSLTATALVFSLLRVSPTPFCVLDEVDAMLDESNVGRFRDLLTELSQATQFVVVTHNRNTVQAADIIYGVTMGRDSASQVISLKLDEVSQVVD